MDVTTKVPANIESYRDLRFPQVFDAAAIGMAICHFDGRILEGNSALGRMFGYDCEELPGVDPWELHAAQFHPEPFDRSDSSESNGSQFLAELLRGERGSFAVEKRYLRKDGSNFWGHLTVSLARNAHHNPVFLVALLEDITQRKRVDERLRQAEKMEVIGRLTGGIAHDFNNLLTGILLYCDLLLSELEPDRRACRHIEEVRLAGEQGAALTQQLLAVARKHAPKPRALSINEIVTSTEKLLRCLIGEHIELVTVLDVSAGMVFADASRLRQVLLNLVVNARDAMGSSPEGQPWRIRLSTKPGQLPGQRPSSLAQSNSVPAVCLIVEDNGCGMNADIRAHLFEPFFTTKDAGEGTGIGLGTVQRIVSEFGGRIEVASEPGSGTRFEVLLPALGGDGDARGFHSQLVDVVTTTANADSNLVPNVLNVVSTPNIIANPSPKPEEEPLC